MKIQSFFGRNLGFKGQSLGLLHDFSKSLSYFLGLLVIAATAAILIGKSSFHEIALWAEHILGFGFISLFAALTGGSLFAFIRMKAAPSETQQFFWLETGLHLSGGITTLALTFTLLGISLGIGGLADQNLTPETVQQVIQSLTAKFSLAFMTTVIGLPSAALLRALLLIGHSHLISKGYQS